MCSAHYNRWLRGRDINKRPIKREPSSGYIDANGYRVVYREGKNILEHRWIISQELGRPLLRHETVHHLNGDRSDNRRENLELWSSYQPSGQRVEDKVAYAKEILALYGNL